MWVFVVLDMIVVAVRSRGGTLLAAITARAELTFSPITAAHLFACLLSSLLPPALPLCPSIPAAAQPQSVLASPSWGDLV